MLSSSSEETPSSSATNASRQFRLLDETFPTEKISPDVAKVLSLANASSRDRRKAQAQATAHAFRLHDTDVGSTRVQIARLTVEIDALKEHLKVHRKDFACKYGFRGKLAKREGLLKYLKRENPADYKATVRALQLRSK